jgi:hypothetical protein
MADMRIVAAADPGRIPHGTANGYRNYGCREACCRLPANAYQREYRRLRRRLARRTGVQQVFNSAYLCGPD